MRDTVLITGGSGYIGTELCKKLRQLYPEYKIISVDKEVFGPHHVKGVTNLDLDVRDFIQSPYDPDLCMINVEATLKRVLCIIHLAGISTEPTAQMNPRETDLVNHMATVDLAKLAKENGVPRFIYASSASVYFKFDTPLVPELSYEDDPVNPISAYSLSKRAAEQGLLELADKDFKAIIFRKGTLYGPSDRMRLDLVLNSFIKNGVLKGKIYVHCNGQIFRPMIDIRDAVSAYIKAISLPLKFSSAIINVNTSNWNLLDLANITKMWIRENVRKDCEVVIEPVGIARNYISGNEIFMNVFDAEHLDIMDSIYEIYSRVMLIPIPDDPIYYNDKWYQKGGEK